MEINPFKCISARLTSTAISSIDDYHQMYFDIRRMMSNDPEAIINAFKDKLVENPIELIKGSKVVQMIGQFFPNPIRDALLEYLTRLEIKDMAIVHELIRLFSLMPRMTSLKQVGLVFPAINAKIRPILLLNMIKFIDADLDQVTRDYLNLIDCAWEHLSVRERCHLMTSMCHLKISDGELRDAWRDKSVKLISQIEDVEALTDWLQFITHAFVEEESITKVLEHLRLYLNCSKIFHSDNQRLSSNKRAKVSLLAWKRPSLHQLALILNRNRSFVDVCKRWIQLHSDSSLAWLFALLFLQMPVEEQSIINIFASATSGRRPQIADGLGWFLSFPFDSHLHFTINRLVHGCAIKGNLEVAGLVLINSLQTEDAFKSRDILTELASYVTSSDKSATVWALRLFEKLCIEHPFLVSRHVGCLKVILDHLDRLSASNIRQYFYSLLRIAIFCLSQNGDGSLWGELMMIFRKQGSSLDSSVRIYASYALLAFIDVSKMTKAKEDERRDDHDDDEEPSCSQAPLTAACSQASNTRLQSMIDEPFLNILDLLLDRNNFDSSSVIYLCKNVVIQDLPEPLLRSINRRLSVYFEQMFIRELRSIKPQQGQEEDKDEDYNLDKDEALIGIVFPTSSPHSISASFVFDLMQRSEKALHAGALDNIDALLGCPILIEGKTTQAICSF